jgi:hypothetical protein
VVGNPGEDLVSESKDEVEKLEGTGVTVSWRIKGTDSPNQEQP